MDDKTQSKLNELSVIEKNINYLISQKHRFRNEILEIDSALEEIKTSEKSYSIIGNIMVLRKAEDINKDLLEKKKFLSSKMDVLNSQETKLKEKAKDMQEVVLKDLGEDK